ALGHRRRIRGVRAQSEPHPAAGDRFAGLAVDFVVALDAQAADAGRFGPKAANLAALGAAGLPVPGGDAAGGRASRLQPGARGLDATAREVFASNDSARARRCALDMRLALMDKPVAPQLAQPLVAAWRASVANEGNAVVRSSALVEDRAGA